MANAEMRQHLCTLSRCTSLSSARPPADSIRSAASVLPLKENVMNRKVKSPQLSRSVALRYIRQSITRDASDKDSPERQRANIQRVCDLHGWTPEGYVDAEGHKSGTKEINRPGWLALKARLGDPDIAALVANDLSRLHRK